MNLKNVASDFTRIAVARCRKFNLALRCALDCIFCRFAFGRGQQCGLGQTCFFDLILQHKKLVIIWLRRYERQRVGFSHRLHAPHTQMFHPSARMNFRPPSWYIHHKRPQLTLLGRVSPIFPLSPISHPLHELTNYTTLCQSASSCVCQAIF